VGPYHDFLLLDRESDGKWELTRFIHDPRAIHLPDDLVRYMKDTLAWIPTTNPAMGESQYGLCMWGPTLIESPGAAIALHVFRSWADLLRVGPQKLVLTGPVAWSTEQGGNGTDTTSAQLAGNYERLVIDRDLVVGVLHQLADWCEQVRDNPGKLYIYHGGV
jgi:hypothetical protein